MESPSLKEILGVTPLYHLVPKQDLAPLVSFSRVQPQALEPKDFLPARAENLLNLVEQEYERGNEAVDGLMGRLLATFRDFDDSELDLLKFKRPVIAGENNEPPELPPISKLYKGLYTNADCIEENDLVEFGNDLHLPDYAEDRLKLLDGSELREEVLQHMSYYKKKADQELAAQNNKRKRPRLDQPSISSIGRKRLTLDRSKLKDSRLVALYNLLDQIAFDDGSDTETDPEGTSRFSMSHLDCTLTTDDFGMILTQKGLRQVGRHLCELAESLSLVDCNADYLKVIQTLCYNTIRHAWSLSKNNETLVIRQSLEASSILLMILNTNTQHRELYLQSYTDCIIENLSEVLPKIVVSNNFTTVVGEAIDCLEKLSLQITMNLADDQVLTRVEYMCVSAINVDGRVKEIEQLRRAMVGVLRAIFKKYPTQRLFIVNEMLSNISKLAHQKGLVRDVPLTRGVNILFFTVFLVELIQSFDASIYEKEVSSLLSLPKSDNPISSTNVKRDIILTGIHLTLNDSFSIANQVAEFFCGRMSAAESIHKSIFLGLVEDLCAMMSHPQWPGAETAISIIIQFLISSMNAQKFNAAEEPFLLEIIGKFGLECLELRIKDNDTLKPDDKEDFSRLCGYHQGVLQHLRMQTTKTPHASSLFQFQLLKTIVFYEGLYADSVAQQDKNQFFIVISSEAKHLSEDSMDIIEVLDLNLSILTNSRHSGQTLVNSLNLSKSYRMLTLATTFNKIYDDFLALLTSSLESTKVKLAAKAIRVLSPLVTRDPKILLHQRINSSISKILSKGSALSKDAVIDLLGQYMFSSKELILKYHILIGNRSSDESILVRKRVMKIMKNVFGASDSLEVMSFSASNILKRLQDEELSIMEAAKIALRNMLFEPDSIKQVSEVMIHLTNGGRDMYHLLVGFIRQELRNSQDSPKRSEYLRKVLDIAFDRIVDAPDSSEVEQTAESFTFIAALAECDSKLVSQDQLISLLPFLVEDLFDRERLCFSALRILRLVLPNRKALRPEYISKTNSILLKRLTKFNTKELHEAVQIIVVFSKISNALPLLKVVLASMKILWPFVCLADVKVSQTEAPKIRKVLHLLGCFGSYCNFEYAKEYFRKSNLGLRSTESIVSLITRYLLFFCQPSTDTVTKTISIKNILCVATHHPRLFLSESILNILDTEFKSSTSSSKLEIVKGLTAFLHKEDENLVKQNDEVVKSTKTSGIEKDAFLDDKSQNVADGVCSSVVQRYTSDILDLCLQDAAEVGEASVGFLQIVTKLGFANPKLCIPTIIALEASPKKHIERIATELHSEIFEKHESLADRNYVEAIRLACDYAKKIEQGGFLQNTSFLRSVYRIVSGNYLAKKKFVNSVAKLFHVKLSTEDLADAITGRDVAIFLALNLLVLNFTSMEEVYLIIFHLDRFITGEGIDLAERISSTIGSVDGKGMSVSNLQLLFVFLQTALAFIYLKHNLAASYSIRPTMMDGFRPSKPEVELRQPPKVVAFVDYPLGDLALETKLSSPGSFGGLFTRLVQFTTAYMS
ncbi:hypothetical protein METBIDRAFT_40914 [Metschnikowia bicuspidata var. bicuspidata NRRL YB-4993]|uniref:Sister chromatid cohesion protein n=1 Tax=Metschnikowia bicuspidata var. bicuspidata NRRL YB-4993 TaxID=869754 RepID=A0A1A0HBX0_9ASCO|nr:hypothetical protein METBIDRAFT_40914 [Metschnikowia bicuspidata var. bicuspidata NRRL YB-4993]OBA21634.1 hypothetical protein METBIDRAFT_40914 [Metschnikowia bicuspidata var. bicuspidata NRRL YB-4993]